MKSVLKREDDRVVIHFDYDCFYASVVEAEDPSLKTKPLAIQQKQIIVTCNYEARRRGLFKLQLITEAKRMCPDVVIVLGEDLTRFRDASKALYNLLRSFSWNQKVERLGFDEVWMDVTDIVEYNADLLNHNDLTHSFLCLDRSDPTRGFSFDASSVAGHAYPENSCLEITNVGKDTSLALRLVIGSHLAWHFRLQLEESMGYTSTVGIATSKLISKLCGNINKPKGQTTLLPPYSSDPALSEKDNISSFLNPHDIGAVPYIGFKIAQRLREMVLDRPPEYSKGLVYGGTREQVTVGDVRDISGLTAERLEKVLAGPGMQHGIGFKIFSLIHGIDDSEVALARNVPRQISIEDSYVRLDTLSQLIQQLISLSTRLLQRMRMDLVDTDGWMAKPSTLRLTTRPRPPLNADGTRARSFQRISRSTHAPAFMFLLDEDCEGLAHRLVHEALLSLFRKLHPEKEGWNLSLVNVGVTGMNEKITTGGDIGSLFRKQQETYDDFNSILPVLGDSYTACNDIDDVRITESSGIEINTTSQNTRTSQADFDSNWSQRSNDFDNDDYNDDYDADDDDEYSCLQCGRSMPPFARIAHERFHELEG